LTQPIIGKSFLGIIYPIGVGWLLTVLLQTRTERNEALQQQKLVEELMAVPDWNALLKMITSFPQTIAPVVGVDLFLRSQEDGEFALAANWSLVHPQGRFSMY
jgi:hypothetical protein